MMGVIYTTGIGDPEAKDYLDFFDEYLTLFDDDFIKSMKDRVVQKKDLTEKMVKAIARIAGEWSGLDIEKDRRGAVEYVLRCVGAKSLSPREQEFADSLTNWTRKGRATSRQVSYLLRIAGSVITVNVSPDLEMAITDLRHIEAGGPPLHVNCLCDTEPVPLAPTEKDAKAPVKKTSTSTRTEVIDEDIKELEAFEAELNQERSTTTEQRQKARDILGPDFYK